MILYRLRVSLAVSLALLALASLPGAAQAASPIAVCFYRGLEPVCVPRLAAGAVEPLEARARARVLLQVMLAGPSLHEQAQAIRSALPTSAQLYDVEIAEAEAVVKLDLPGDYLYGQFDPVASDLIVNQIAATLDPLNLCALDVQARGRDGIFHSLSYFLRELPPEHKHSTGGAPYVASSGTSRGALEGKAVYVSAGHGWYWSEGGAWLTQRVKYQDFVEDFNNAEVVNQYLVQYLRNAGADVWPVREHDMNTSQMIVTRDSPDYAEQGTWATGTQPGYGGADYGYALVSASATATATWSFTPSGSGRYAVYVWYRPAANRAPDAHYFVYHAGGMTEARVDQTVHGATWRYLGTYPFAAGRPARVCLTNQSAVANEARVVVADAIRVGGGMGSERGDTPPGYAASGRPRWEEAARYWAKYQGAPPSVYNSVTGSCDSYGASDGCDDITARPLYAEWESLPGQDSVYISWHTNGYNGSARGTESYIYLTPTPGSAALQSFVHSTLVDDIRAGWDPNWTDRGMKRRDLGEVRRLSTMPGVLLEVAFHDQPDDANALKDPRFEQLAARAVYKGIVKYWADQDGRPAVFLPEAPAALMARNVAPPAGETPTQGSVRLDWLPSPTDDAGLLGDAATSYRVYTSSDGLGWSSGIAVAGTAYTLTGLVPGQVVLARVTGVNDGGESFPTSVVGVRAGWPALVLIVDGFGRLDRHGLIAQDDGGVLGVNYRMFLDRINSFSYVVQHGLAIALPFDSANRRALGTLPLALSDYAIVDWMAGEEQSSTDPLPPDAPEIALSAAEQAALQSYVAGGGALFISGSELGYDLVHKGHGAAFYASVLKATYLGDDAGTYTVAPAPGGIFSDLAAFRFDDGASGTYNVDWPDYIAPAGGATSALAYVGGQGHSAALQYDGGCSRLVYLGFPFETICDAQVRRAVMDRVITFLSGCMPPETTIHSPESGAYYNRAPQVTGVASQAAGAGIAAVRLQIASAAGYWNGAAWQPAATWVTANGTAAWTYTWPSQVEGLHEVTAQARSAAGVLDPSPPHVTFTLDTISPTVPVPITPTHGITVAGVGTTLVYAPSQDATLAGYVVEVDGRPFTASVSSAFKLPIALADGPHVWRVRAFDRAGNRSRFSRPASFSAVSEHVYLPIIWRG